jgi:hypothetical protein
MSPSRPSRSRHYFTAPLGAAIVFLWAGCQKSEVATASATATSAPTAPAAPVAQPAVVAAPAGPDASAVVAQFHKVVAPILDQRCSDCHGGGENKGGLSFDKLSEDRIARDPQFWLKVLRNTRAHLMPPLEANNALLADERANLEKWIITAAFGLDPAKPDPGRVTLHRLNRHEYQNTIRDLLGVDFDTHAVFPDDDSGYGFDNVADALNMSPLLMEKYLNAAQTVVDKAVPKIGRVPAVVRAGPGDFRYDDGTPATIETIRGSGLGDAGIRAAVMPYTEEATVTYAFTVKEAGDYRIAVEQNLRGDFVYVPQRATVTIFLDGKQVSQNEYSWAANRDSEDVHTMRWEPGVHTVAVTLKPQAPNQARPGGAGADNKYNLKGVRLEGPLDPARWVNTPNYTRFFTRPIVPSDPAERRAYAKELLGAFANKAFRRPVSDESITPLVAIAEQHYNQPDTTFEAGIGRAMVAVLASPRFLYRVEQPDQAAAAGPYANVDEHSLATRLSYFLWSTMPDDELRKLAAAGQLRANLANQVKRMLADPRSHALMENFTGQWLQTRLVTTVPLIPAEILAREAAPAAATAAAVPGAGDGAAIAAAGVGGGRAGRGAGAAGRGAGARGARGGGRGARGGGGAVLTEVLRESLKVEAEKYFEHIVRENRSVDELLSSDYTFLNDTLASAYGIPEVEGSEFRKVTLPADNPRGGVLTMGSVLMITSNPTRTSPVKRGKWVLDNILHTPTSPPPPNVPALEEVKIEDPTKVPSMRESMVKHREDAICASCHNRMDPLGLALENFNALGQWRTQELNQPIDPAGELATGEKFADIRELKKILVSTRKLDFYRALTEKLLIYATGRGLQYYDVPTVDKIVAELERSNGAFSTLLMGVIESAPFQQQRNFSSPPPAPAKPAPQLTQN